MRMISPMIEINKKKHLIFKHMDDILDYKIFNKNTSDNKDIMIINGLFKAIKTFLDNYNINNNDESIDRYSFIMMYSYGILKKYGMDINMILMEPHDVNGLTTTYPKIDEGHPDVLVAYLPVIVRRITKEINNANLLNIKDGINITLLNIFLDDINMITVHMQHRHGMTMENIYETIKKESR